MALDVDIHRHTRLAECLILYITWQVHLLSYARVVQFLTPERTSVVNQDGSQLRHIASLASGGVFKRCEQEKVLRV